MNFKPCSLAQLFDPPDDYQGVFGWICGYSADAGFLEDAAERFSGLTKAQREHQGRMMLAVMLDPGNPQILPSEVPGVLHLPARSLTLPFLLLHAKVAILGFQGLAKRIAEIMGEHGRASTKMSKMLEVAGFDLPEGGKVSPILADQLGQVLDRIDIAIEPDRRYGSGVPQLDDQVFIFKATGGGAV